MLDTNVIVSASLFASSVPRRAAEKVLRNGIPLFSDPTMEELKNVLFRPRFDRYVSRADRALFLSQLSARAEFVPIIQIVRECRDPKDDRFLEVALNGRADVIVTGDADLLAMHPWRGIAISSPTKYIGS